MRTRDKVVVLAACALLLLIGIGCVYGRVAFSPDGKRIATVVYGDWPVASADADAEVREHKDPPYELWVTDLATWEHHLVVRDELVGPSPAWSPDGGSLWFVRGKDERMALARWDGETVTEVVAARLDGDPAVLLTTPPQLLPGGGSVIVSKGENGQKDSTRVVQFDVATGKEIVLADRAGGAVLSPAGDRLIFLAHETLEEEPIAVYVMSVDGSNRRKLATLAEDLNDVGFCPLAWSPDGTLVAWTDTVGGDASTDHMSVTVADVETGAHVFVSASGEWCRVPVFAAAGDALFYAASAEKGDMPRTMRADLVTGAISEVVGGDGCVPAGVSPDGRTLALRRMASTDDDEFVRNQTVVRLVTLATGEFHDDWITARQRRAFAAAEVIAAEEIAAEAELALQRAKAHLDAMAKQFPGSESGADALKIQSRLDALRKTEPETPK